MIHHLIDGNWFKKRSVKRILFIAGFLLVTKENNIK